MLKIELQVNKNKGGEQAQLNRLACTWHHWELFVKGNKMEQDLEGSVDQNKELE